MNTDYFRGLAARCRTSARSCSDPYAKEEFGRLAREFDTRASEQGALTETQWSTGSRRPEPSRGFAGDH